MNPTETTRIRVKRTNECIKDAKNKPTPKMLFGEFWLEGELSILFADTGKGKSVLAVQIAESIARGRPIKPLEMTAKAQRTLYFDFELTEKQFEMRYAADPRKGQELLKKHYKFSERFYRADIVHGSGLPDGFSSLEEFLRAVIEKEIRRIGAKVVIIDNITYIRGPNDTAKEAIPLMRHLRRLKSELGLSILVLAHTPKRETARRLTVNDLQGSKALSNFADNIFAIGQSNIDTGVRYLKHIKQRSTGLQYDASYVPAFEILKRDGNFLEFEFRNFSEEEDHLSTAKKRIQRDRARAIRQLSEDGMTQRKIAERLGISLTSVNRYLHLGSPELDDRVYSYDPVDEEEDEEPEEPPEEDLDQLLAEALEMRRDTNIAIGGGGYGYDDIYEEFAERRAAAGLPPKDFPKIEEFDEDDDEPGEPGQLGELGQLTELRELKPGYEYDSNGRLRRRMTYGWDYCVEASE